MFFKIKLSSTKLLMSECSTYVLKAQHFGKISALQDPGFRFGFWVLFSILGVTVESNTPELKKPAQIFLQQFTSPRLQHILWSTYSFPDFSIITAWIWRSPNSMELCGTAEHERNARAAGEEHMYIPLKVLLLVFFPAFLAFFPRTHWQHEHSNQLLKHYRYSNPRNGSH